MKDVKVSVIVPVYNLVSTIDRAINSILNQSLKDIEIIVVNDGSTDASLKIITHYRDEFDNIVVVNQENGGVSSARNCGIKRARGKYIAFVDGDDFLEIDYLKRLYERVEQDENALAVCGVKEVFDGLSVDCDVNNYGGYGDYLLNCSLVGHPYNKLFKKSIIDSQDILFDSELAINEDFLFNLQFLFSIEFSEMSFVKNNYYNYVQYEMSTIRNKQNFNSSVVVVDKILAILSENEYKFSKREYDQVVQFIFCKYLIKSNYRKLENLKLAADKYYYRHYPLVKEKISKYRALFSNSTTMLLLYYRIRLKLVWCKPIIKRVLGTVEKKHYKK